MKRFVSLFLVAFLFVPGVAAAQETGDEIAYIYASYFHCNPTGEARADEIIARNFKPHYDSAVEQGNLLSWSWLSHYVGGELRRAHVLTATNMDDLLDASGALGEIIEETTPEAGRAFTEVCSSHVDYIWESSRELRGGPLGEARGDVGFSTYFICDISREERADQLVAEVFAPIYNKYRGPDGLVSWAWLKHNVGGQWRRLLTLTGPSHKSLARTRQAIIAESSGRRIEKASREFLEICNVHEDYMWDIEIETP